jgi:signal transduction histidine kinase
LRYYHGVPESDPMSQKRQIFDVLRPPVFATEEQTQRALAFWRVGWGILLINTPQAILLMIELPATIPRRMVTALFLWVLIIPLLVVNKRGRTRFASWCLLLALVALITARAWSLDGLAAPVAPFFVIFVVIGGLLLGQRGGAVIALACIAGSVLLTVGSEQHWLPLSQREFTPRVLLLYVVLFVGLTLVLENMIASTFRQNLERLESLSQRLVDLQESERKHIARELHDHIGQTLTAAKILVQMLQRDATSDIDGRRLGEATSLIDTCLHEVRSLSLGLRPPLLDDFGLAAALRWLTSHDANVSVEFRQNNARPRYAGAIETACFRVAQEALNNALKHANAQHVVVELEEARDRLLLRVRDDGTGFDAVAARTHALQGASLGLIGMAERVTMVGGSIEWRRPSDGGTEVEAAFPLDAAGAAA